MDRTQFWTSAMNSLALAERSCLENQNCVLSIRCPSPKYENILLLLLSGFIIDTRTPAAINNARNKGGGLESDVYYPAWKKITKSIDRFHFLLDSYSKLMEACCDTSVSHDKWLNRLALSSWLTHVKEILNCGCLVAQCVDQVRKINWSFCNLRVDYSFINSK